MISTKKHGTNIGTYLYNIPVDCLPQISLVNPRTSEVSETPRLPSLDALFGWPGKYGYRCYEIPSIGANKRTGKGHKNML